MTRTLRSSKPASDEFAEAVRWYEEQRLGLGADFYTSVTETTGLIESHPEIGTPASVDHLTRRVLVPRFPYQIVYRLRPSEIVIVAVAHLKRRPGYWKNRI